MITWSEEATVNHKIVEEGEALRSKVYLFVIGLVTGMALTVWLMREPVVDERQERAMVNTCKLPDADGAMTVYVMESEQIKCWRWK